jgi:hypothetical protein
MMFVSCAKTSRRGGRRAIPFAAVLLGLAAVGCRGDRSAGDGHEGDHAGHVAPAHKPKDFPGAVRRLRELSRTIDDGVSQGRLNALIEDRTLPIALDIASWLPEIAADCDMPEKPWDIVNAQSEILVASYKTLLCRANGTSPGDPGTARETDRSVAVLERLVGEADPRWFEGSAPRALPPQ